MKTTKPSILVSQNQALTEYMDSLLGVNKSADIINDEKTQNNHPEIVEHGVAIIKPLDDSSMQGNHQKPQSLAELRIDQKESSMLFDVKLDAKMDNEIGPTRMENKKQLNKTDELRSKHKDEPPRLNLSLFLPDVPSPEELDIIERKEQQLINKKLHKELQKSQQVNDLLKGELELSLKKLDDYGKTHSEVYAPDWAQPSFQVMLFNVGNLKLALPLNDLNSIVVWDEKYINRMPGCAKWYLGLIQHQGKNVPVIDTLQQVIPPERVASFIKKRGKFKNIIVFDNNSWGLACEDIIGIKTLTADEVKWRSTRTTRRWLFGTVKEQMCALLDSVEFASMLSTGEGSLIAK